MAAASLWTNEATVPIAPARSLGRRDAFWWRGQGARACRRRIGRAQRDRWDHRIGLRIPRRHAGTPARWRVTRRGGRRSSRANTPEVVWRQSLSAIFTHRPSCLLVRL